jgi:hypothetical protein
MFDMLQPSNHLNGARLVCFAEVTKAVRPTAGTTHRKGGEALGPARGLAICQYADESYFYLFYCDADWAVLTDTFHLSLEGAMRQAEFEYEGISRQWTQAVSALEPTVTAL